VVAIIRCDSALEDKIDDQYGEGRSEYTQAWRRTMWAGTKTHLTLLVGESGHVRWLGRAHDTGNITTLEKRIKVADIEAIDPVSLEDLRAAVGSRHKSVVDRAGILPEGGGKALVEALKELRPETAEVIARLQQSRQLDIPDDESGDLLRQERDGLGLLFDVANIDRDVRDRWTPTTPGVPFLEGIDEASTLEDHLVIHDVERFGDWIESSVAHVAWRAFTKDDRTLYVMNANRTAVEHTLGVDVVYFHEEQQSFVLVQYKKLTRPTRDSKSEAVYRPDGSLDDEIRRMEGIDEMCREAGGAYRLLPRPCWFKLCDASHTTRDPSRLIPGMYLPLEYFSELRATLKGPRGGTVLSWENVSRWVSNSMFVDLVQGGWTGSRGTATDEIKRLVRESIQTGHAVVLGVDSAADDTPTTSQPSRREVDPSLPF
jgi:hypothetical protein